MKKMRHVLFALVAAAMALLNTQVARAQCEVQVMETPTPDVLTYFGAMMASDGQRLVMSDTFASEAPGVVYVLERGSDQWTIDHEIPSPGLPANASFGLTADICGQTIVITAPDAVHPPGPTGAVYIYHLEEDGSATQEAILRADEALTGGRFGERISIDGDRLAIGWRVYNQSAGRVYVYRRDAGIWSIEAVLESPSPAPFSYYGSSVAIDGEILLVAEKGRDRVHGYRLEDSTWVYDALLETDDAWLVGPVTLSGDLAMIGSLSDAVFFTELVGGTWTDLVAITTENSEGPDPWFGGASAIGGEGTMLAVGAKYDWAHGFQSGAVHLFHRAGTGKEWIEVAKLSPADGSPGDSFGAGLAIVDNEVIAGAWRGPSPGSIHVFRGIAQTDCNANGASDACDIYAGDSADKNSNGVPDECDPSPADLDGDGVVGLADLLILLADWGVCPAACPADLDDDGSVGFIDLVMLLGEWGA